MRGCGLSDGFRRVGVEDLFRVEVVEGNFVEALEEKRRRGEFKGREEGSGTKRRRGGREGGKERRDERGRTAPGPQTHCRVPLGATGGRQGAKRVSSKGRSLKMCESQKAEAKQKEFKEDVELGLRDFNEDKAREGERVDLPIAENPPLVTT